MTLSPLSNHSTYLSLVLLLTDLLLFVDGFSISMGKCQVPPLFVRNLKSSNKLCSLAGLLKVGTPKTWDSSKRDLKYIRQAGTSGDYTEHIQFSHVIRRRSTVHLDLQPRERPERR